jgi:peptidase MA superfamily protein/tetratricopeptide repeat protein
MCLADAMPGAVSADTIYLKNGRKIVASHVVRENGQVSYETSTGHLSLPASIVEKVVYDDLSLDSAAGTAADRAANLPIAPPNVLVPPANSEAARAAVRDGSIDLGLLGRLESEADVNPTPTVVARVVAAETAAAQFGISVGDFEQAAAHYTVGLRYAPGNVGLLLETAYLHLRRSEYSAALDLLDRARRIEPESPEVAKLAGWAYYGLSRIGDAVSEWKRALALKPDVEVQHALEKAERDAQEESDYREGETAHFRLRYNGGAAPELARDVLRTLETEFEEISSTLNYVPPEPIGVILYTNQTFVDITRAPAWVGALNDGRIRVPVEGLTSMTAELARVLKHELTHSFVGQKSGGRCPVWLQEGIAQYMEGKRSRSVAGALSAAYEQHMEFSLASYETSWLNLPRDTAVNAYAWSLAVVEAIVNVDGMGDIERILERIAAQSATEDAIRAVLRDSYADLMQSTVQYLRKAYL